MPSRAPKRSPRWLGWLALLAIVAAMGALRWRLLDVPFERDEGEYAYAAWLWLRGEAPYAHAYTMKLPGTIAAYAAIFAIGGESVAAIGAGLIAVNAATIALVFALARRFFGTPAALATAAAFGLLSLSRGLLGFTANSEHFVLLPAIAGLLCTLRALDRGRVAALVGGGLLFGVALLMKQHAAFFLLFAAAWLALDGRRRGATWRSSAQRVAILLGAALVPLAATGAAFAAAGAFDALWFWTVAQARAYVGHVPIADGLSILWLRVTGNASIFTTLWLLALAGLALSFADRDSARRRFLALFALFSFAAVCPGLFFREHYFLLLLPAAALLAGAAVEHALRACRTPAAKAAVSLALALVFAAAVFQERAYLFEQRPGEILRAAYGSQGFEESSAVAAYVRERTAPEERIGVLGSEPQIYFYAGRRAVTGYLYMYPLLENHPLASRMQLDLIDDFEQALPAFVVATSNPRSWLPRSGAPRTVLEWVPAFLEAHYERVAFVDHASDGTPIHAFGEDAIARAPADETGLQVYRRKDRPRP